jgi:hypothetical protein
MTPSCVTYHSLEAEARAQTRKSLAGTFFLTWFSGGGRVLRSCVAPACICRATHQQRAVSSPAVQAHRHASAAPTPPHSTFFVPYKLNKSIVDLVDFHLKIHLCYIDLCSTHLVEGLLILSLPSSTTITSLGFTSPIAMFFIVLLS